MGEVDPQRVAFGSRLAEARKAAGLSGEVVASKFSYKAGKKTVSQWETGRGVPDALVLRALCRLYGVSADSLLWDRAEPIPGQAQAQRGAFPAAPGRVTPGHGTRHR